MSPKLVFTLNMTILFSPSIELNLSITWDNEVYVFKCIWSPEMVRFCLKLTLLSSWQKMYCFVCRNPI